jgi:nucleotide-binding universal stress UspA family protein
MNVLVYFDGVQRTAAQRTIALLAEAFVFDVDLLLYAVVPNMDFWTGTVRGQVQVMHADGPFDQAVERACAAKRYDLVVAAPNDRRGLVRMLLGSRLTRLVGAAPATIWVPRGDNVRLQRIVVGVGGGPQSEHDARLAARLAVAYDARLELVHVVSQLPLFYTRFREFHSALENDETIAAMAPGVGELRRIYTQLKDEGVKVEMVVRPGVVADVLASVTTGEGRQPPADLLVIGAHAPSVYAGADYYENLAEQITEAVNCPALVVHAKSAWSEWVLAQRDAAR